MGTFLREQPAAIIEYDESIVWRLIGKGHLSTSATAVAADKFTVEFKFGVTVDVDE